MTNFKKIKQMSVEDMAEMLLDASEKHFILLYAVLVPVIAAVLAAPAGIAAGAAVLVLGQKVSRASVPRESQRVVSEVLPPSSYTRHHSYPDVYKRQALHQCGVPKSIQDAA